MKSQEIMIKDETSFACKICFNCHSDVEDPLISPCKCSGSMKYIHYRCLKQSINIKINTKSGDNYVSYLWKNFECEICLTTYPKYIKYNSIMYNLLDLDIKYDQYIVFDYSLYDDNMRKCVKKGIIVTKIRDTEDITIGRTTTNTLKLKDISVSRLHCSITKKDNNIYVTDRNSKFGTLLHLNKSFILAHDIKNKQKSFYFDTNINIVSGKVLLNLKTNSNCNYLQSFFSNALCCRYKSSSEDEFVINVDEFNDEESNNFKSIEKSNVNDTYIDYILNLDLNINSENNIL
jgi:E3 ubiquitin-protein ligase DOA10